MNGIIIRHNQGQLLEIAWPDDSGRLRLADANLRGANLGWADLGWADLRKADLRGANLTGANLRWANLGWADLSEANLTRAALSEADLSEADLSGADLSGARLPAGWTIRQWSGCGSARRMTILAIWPRGHRVWCGCFAGSVEAFAAWVEQTHTDNPTHLEDYREIVASMRRLLTR